MSLLDFSEVDETGRVEVGVDIFEDGEASLVSSCRWVGIEIWNFDLWKEGKGKS